jgi:hypothetical protein
LKREWDDLALRLGDHGQLRACTLERHQGAGGEPDEDHIGVFGFVERLVGDRGRSLSDACGAGQVGLGAFAGAYEELRCYESWDDGLSPEVRSGGRWHSATDWQWTAQLVLALIGFCCVVAAVHFTTRREYRRAVLVGGFGLALYGVWVRLLAQGSV